MAQREVGERLAAESGKRHVRRALGARAARVRGARCCGRSRALSFIRCRTSTRCSSACRRRGPAATVALRGLVNGAFAHRRKTLVGSLALSGGSGSRPAAPRSREEVRRRWSVSAIPPTCAPSASRPRTSAALGAAARAMSIAPAPLSPRGRWPPRRSTSGCSSGRLAREDGRHELVTVMQSISLADELTLGMCARGGGARRGRLPRGARSARGEPGGERAGGLPRRHRLGRSAAAPEHRQADPRGRRSGRRLGGRGRRAAAGAARVGARRRAAAARARRRARRRRARADRSRGAGWPAARASCWRRCRTPTRSRSACSCCRRRAGSRPPRSMRRPIGSALARSARDAARASQRAAPGTRAERGRCPRRASCWRTIWSAAAISLCPEIAARARAGARGGRGDRAGERLGADGARAVPSRQRSRTRRTGRRRPARAVHPRRSAPTPVDAAFARVTSV